jgi:predicted Zn finger-like uncharacterized protein
MSVRRAQAMTAITACPQCQTRFRVTEEQLRARHGDVRCGRCHHIFNARETLLEEIPEPETSTGTENPAPGEAPETLPEASQAETAPEIGLTPEPGRAEEAAPPEIIPEPEPALEPQPEIRVIRVQPPPERPESKVSPERPKYGPPPKPRRAWPWALASLLLLLGLGTQGTYYFRDMIAASFPALRPALVQACDHLQCRVSLPRNPALLSIETTELNADPARANIVVLTSVLRNRASHDQAYPSLELTLTNTRDEMVARRTFVPREYLRRGAAIEQGIPAGSEIAVKLLMDLGDIKAAGYRLYLFYPS